MASDTACVRWDRPHKDIANESGRVTVGNKLESFYIHIIFHLIALCFMKDLPAVRAGG
jgi:hypothetical protein